MPIAHEFEYVKPDNLAEVLEFLTDHKSKARLLAGGTDLTVRLKEDLEKPEVVIDIKGIKGLDQISFDGTTLEIGPCVTFSDLITSDVIKENFPLLWEAATTVASVSTRNRATVVGNICSAVPSLDSGPALLNYEAVIRLQNQKGEREISIGQWFTGPKKTARNDDEIVRGIKITKPVEKCGTCYVKLGRYRGEDLAQAGLGVIVTDKNQYKLAFCALGPVAKRAASIEILLNGKALSDNLIEEAKKLIVNEIAPITDIRSSKEYRMHIAGVMLERGLKKAVARLNGEKLELTNILGG